ncbi:PorP/SprF family type IX secretion system membrane protein [Marivirga salinae]|uniref:PorP/SprF family type IX secretion system membrane protein n=1 Tax=Marivirga salinarum TaxID=3059078 RepID=A0AA51N9I1_9BACT|nr:PorP/SprF family type IX secretion system membrane protein [Marivirga sp. BDSF4-3]WMN10944.1 PorP/SprF family type IX secretion system membrane protein [Marivirga sp. BDSF4-3]
MKRFLILLAIGMIASVGMAQQMPANYNYLLDPFSINPAVAGYDIDPVFNFSARGSFQGMEGSPRSMFFSTHGKALSPKVGLGANFYSDKIGVTSTNGVYGSYSYSLISKNKNSFTSWGFHPNVLSFGLRAGVSFFNESLRSLKVDDDPNFEKNISIVRPSVGVGLYFSKNKFFAGLSIPEVLTVWENENLNLNRHLFLNAGYELILNHTSKIQLNSLIKVVKGSPIQADGNAILEFKDKIKVGLGYRSVSYVNFMIGFQFINDLDFNYFYELPLSSSVKQMNFNIHEVSLRYRLGR